jgi:lipopolysaccharide transport system permease protein
MKAVQHTAATRAPASLWQAARACIRHRHLIRQLAVRDVIGRYRGSVLGLGWSLFNPLLMLIVYTFVFSIVFNAKWNAKQVESTIGFGLILFVGLMVHGFFAELINRAPALVLGNVNLVKKVVFPLEILPIVALCSALFHTAVSFAVFLVALLLSGAELYATCLLFPVILAPLALGMLGLAWFLASLGVFLRDVAQTTGILTTVLLFLSPVFYPASALPARYQPLFLANPLTFIIEQARAVVIWGHAPDWSGLAWYTLAAAAVAAAGFWWFQRTRKGFADVI